MRQLLGYLRLDWPEWVQPFNAHYTQWCLLLKFLCPNMKLREKLCQGSRIVKRFEAARTPCQRLQPGRWIDRTTQRRLRDQLKALDPFTLKNETDQQLKMSWDTQRNIKPSTAQSIPLILPP